PLADFAASIAYARSGFPWRRRRFLRRTRLLSRRAMRWTFTLGMARSGGHGPTVDVDALAGDRGRGVRREKEARRGDLRGFRKPAERGVLLREAIEEAVRIALGTGGMIAAEVGEEGLGAHVDGADGVDADAARAE